MTTGDASLRCIFCMIVRGERAAHHVMSDALCAAFLDARPLFPGHVLIVPRAHRETIADLKEAELLALFSAAQRVAGAMEPVLGAQGSFVAMNNRVSQSVPHAHVHVVPRRKGDGLRGLLWPRHDYASDAEAAELAAKLRALLL